MSSEVEIAGNEKRGNSWRKLREAFGDRLPID